MTHYPLLAEAEGGKLVVSDPTDGDRFELIPLMDSTFLLSAQDRNHLPQSNTLAFTIKNYDASFYRIQVQLSFACQDYSGPWLLLYCHSLS